MEERADSTILAIEEQSRTIQALAADISGAESRVAAAAEERIRIQRSKESALSSLWTCNNDVALLHKRIGAAKSEASRERAEMTNMHAQALQAARSDIERLQSNGKAEEDTIQAHIVEQADLRPWLAVLAPHVLARVDIPELRGLLEVVR